MSTKRMCRSMLAVAILVASLMGTHATQSLAEESPAVELVEALAAGTTGSDAYVSVTSTAGFASAGGEALLEPGTPNEERFQYTSVDAESNRLVGLVRPIPLDHPVGALVQADAPAPATSAEPSPTGEAEAPASLAEDAKESSAPAAAGSSVDTNVVDDVIDTVAGAIGDPCATVDCEGVADPCERIDCGIIHGRDPCDPESTGQTCIQYVTATLAQILDNGRCDPYNTGQTCEEYVIGTLASMIQSPALFCSDYGKEFTLQPTTGCAAFILALNPNSPPQNCSSSVEMGLICGAYGALLIGGEDFGGGSPAGSVPAQPTEVAGVALPPPASGPGSNLECWDGWHRFYYKNPGNQVVGYGKVTVSWCGNDGTNRIRYFDPDYDAWVRGDWSAVLSISKTSSGVVCNEYDAGSGYCNQRTAWSGWDVYKGWCPYCQRRTPTMQFTGWWQGAHKGAAQGY